jgi:hypothetical protein
MPIFLVFSSENFLMLIFFLPLSSVVARVLILSLQPSSLCR